MQWFYVLDWSDQKTVRVVGAEGFTPVDSTGLATMVDTTMPVPEAALSLQMVNGVPTVVVDPAITKNLLPSMGTPKLFG